MKLLMRISKSGKLIVFLTAVLIITGLSYFIFVKQDRESITLFFAGDIMLSRSVAKQIEKHGNDLRFPFLNIASAVGKADIAFANLEGPISDRGEKVGSIYSFRALPGVVEGLRYAGFDVMSVANNHIWDYGRYALLDTLTLLRSSEILPVGAGKNYAEANQPVFITRDSTVFAFLAYTNLYPETLEAGEKIPGVSHFDPNAIAAIVRDLKESKKADFVVVSLHWGEEYKTHAGTSQRRIARGLIDAGVDLVIGHHPNVVQEVEHYKDGLIAYSLGNFVFDQSFSTGTMAGLALEVSVSKAKITGVKQIPIVINKNFQPLIADLKKGL